MTKTSFFIFLAVLLAPLIIQPAGLAQDGQEDASLKPPCPHSGFPGMIARRAFGGPGMDPRPCPRHGGPFASLTGENKLSDEQYEKLHNLRLGFMSKMDPVFADLRTARRELDDLMLRPEIDSKKVWQTQKTINNARSKMADLRLENRLDNLNVLTPEQRKQIRLKMVRGEDHCPARMKTRFRR